MYELDIAILLPYYILLQDFISRVKLQLSTAVGFVYWVIKGDCFFQSVWMVPHTEQEQLKKIESSPL